MSRLNVDQIYSRTGSSVPEIEIPMLYVTLGTNQDVTDNAERLVRFDTVNVDTHSWWVSSPDPRYVPQIAGYYMFSWRVAVNGTTIVQYYSSLRKNESTIIRGERILGISATTTAGIGGSCSVWLEMNGTTDYVDVIGLVDASSGTQFSNSSTYLQAYLIRKL
jgi:hypothetical protein